MERDAMNQAGRRAGATFLFWVITGFGGGATSAVAVPVDVGDVVVSGGNLTIATTSDGQRTVTGEVDGPYGTVALGNGGTFTGTLTVTGVGGLVSTSNTHVGNGSTGVLVISAGATFDHTDSNSSLFIGSNNPSSDGTVTVTGAGSLLNAARAVQVGFGSQTGGGTATLNVLQGGMVTAPRMPVGAATDATPGATGTLNISGTGSLVHLFGQSSVPGAVAGTFHNNMPVGIGSTGAVNVTNGGRLLIESTLANHQPGMSLGSTSVIGNNTLGSLAGTGTATVSGTGSEIRLRGSVSALAPFLNVGSGGQNAASPASTGTLNIQNGGQVALEDTSNTRAATVSVGQVSSGTTGFIVINGAQSQLTVDGRINLNNGVMTVSSQGQVQSAGANIGGVAGGLGSATVSGVGSQWLVGGGLVPGASRTFVSVGVPGTGILTVANGAQMVVDGGTNPGAVVTLGTLAGGDGKVNVSGAQSRLEIRGLSDPLAPDPNIPGSTLRSAIVVGRVGTGALNITFGGQVAIESTLPGTSTRDGVLIIGQAAGSSGTVGVTGVGSLLSVPTSIRVAQSGTGSLTVSNGGVVSTANLTVGAGGKVNGSGGTINGNVTVMAGGSFVPGSSPGTLTVNGDFDLLAGAILELEAFTPVSDLLDINGTFTAEVGSEIRILLDEDVTPGSLLTLITTVGGDTLGVTRTSTGFEFQTAGIFGDLVGIPGLVDVQIGQFDVPEPTTLSLLVLGAISVMLYALRHSEGVLNRGR
jgi:T5SS/PEP-CTERM-associated repeat protein